MEKAKAKMSKQIDEPALHDMDDDYLEDGDEFECLEEEDEDDCQNTSQNLRTQGS